MITIKEIASRLGLSTTTVSNVMITIKEIASRLGLSTTTVSNVIHGKTKEVSAETIARVQKFLEEVEYVPNINARNLAQGQSKIIGVVLKTLDFRLWYSDNILSDPFVAEMIGGIERAVREAGYYMMLYISDDIAEIIQHISIWNVDGLILFSMMDDDGNRVAAKYHKPIVCIDTYSSEKSDDFINVGLDDEKGTCQAVKYLIENGHRKIGFLTDNRVGVDRARFWGYRRALKESGIEYSDRDFFLFKPTKSLHAQTHYGPSGRHSERKSRRGDPDRPDPGRKACLEGCAARDASGDPGYCKKNKLKLQTPAE